MKVVLSASFVSLAVVPGLLWGFSRRSPSGHDFERNSGPSEAEAAENSPPPGDFLIGAGRDAFRFHVTQSVSGKTDDISVDLERPPPREAACLPILVLDLGPDLHERGEYPDRCRENPDYQRRKLHERGNGHRARHLDRALCALAMSCGRVASRFSPFADYLGSSG